LRAASHCRPAPTVSRPHGRGDAAQHLEHRLDAARQRQAAHIHGDTDQAGDDQGILDQEQRLTLEAGALAMGAIARQRQHAEHVQHRDRQRDGDGKQGDASAAIQSGHGAEPDKSVEPHRALKQRCEAGPVHFRQRPQQVDQRGLQQDDGQQSAQHAGRIESAQPCAAQVVDQQRRKEDEIGHLVGQRPEGIAREVEALEPTAECDQQEDRDDGENDGEHAGLGRETAALSLAQPMRQN
jgi:hypothetical protein